MIRSSIRDLKKLLIKDYDSPVRKGKKKDFIFIHINKTGGTSIAKAIGLPIKQHYSVKDVIVKVGEEKLDEVYTFSVVRNPWTKVVSHYKYRVKTNQTAMAEIPISFKDWVKLTYGKDKDPFYYDKPLMFAPQLEWLKDFDGNIKADKIIKFDSLNAEFKNIAKSIGINPELPHLNATKKVDYKDFYDTKTIDIIGEWFEEDIEKFGFSPIV